MRHIPFIHQLCSHSPLRSNSVYIQNCSGYFFHVVFILYLGLIYICYLRMRSSGTTYCQVQRHFEIILSSLWHGIGTRYSETLTLKSTQIHRNMALTHSTFEFCDLTKGNGVEHALVAPYHPRSNSQEIFLDHCAKPCVKIIFFRLHQNVVLGLLISLLLLLLCF